MIRYWIDNAIMLAGDAVCRLAHRRWYRAVGNLDCCRRCHRVWDKK